MNVKKITDRQIEFIGTLYNENEYVQAYWECFYHERVVAIQLRKRGVIEFEDGEDPSKEHDFFMARMTNDGYKWFDKRSEA